MPQKVLQRQRGKRYMYCISITSCTLRHLCFSNTTLNYLNYPYYYYFISVASALASFSDKMIFMNFVAYFDYILLDIYFQKKKSSKRKKRRVSYCCWLYMSLFGFLCVLVAKWNLCLSWKWIIALPPACPLHATLCPLGRAASPPWVPTPSPTPNPSDTMQVHK